MVVAMPAQPIPFHQPYYGRDASRMITDALAEASLHGNGTIVSRLEDELTELLGAPVLLTPSCTSALEIACQAIGIGPGDEVIVPGYTFLSSAAAFTASGARILFVDVMPDTLCIDPAAVEAAMSPRTRAIVAVHYAGQATSLQTLRGLADAYGVALIEDAAQGFLCRQGDVWLGRAGHIGCYSFHDTKVFSAGEGGAIVINDPSLLDRVVRIREKGSNRREFLAGRVDKYGWVTQGTSGYMGGLPAALLSAQVSDRERIIALRTALYGAYAGWLSEACRQHGIAMLRPRDDETLTFHILWLMLKNADEARALRDHLAAMGIASSGHYPALHRSSFAREKGFSSNRDLPVTDMAADCLLRLPFYTMMTTDDVERVSAGVLAFLNGAPC